MRPRKIGIIGSGLAGIVAGFFLRRRGHEVTLIEKRPDPLQTSCAPGRCNLVLTLTKRGLDALDAVGIGEEIRAACVPLSERLVLQTNGHATRKFFDDTGNKLYGIGRNRLNECLHRSIRARCDMPIRFDAKVRQFDFETASVGISDREGEKILRFDTILGADGAYSSVRLAMQKQRGFNFMQEYAEHAATELQLPAGTLWSDEQHAEHFLPREGAALIGFPNPDRSFTLALLLPLEGPNSAPELVEDGRADEFFASRFPEVAPFLPNLARAMATHPPEPMVSIKCGKWYLGDKVCLIGDSAHAFFPSSGQGANAAFEDCLVLDSILEETEDDFESAFALFYERRKPATDALCTHTIEQTRRPEPPEEVEARRTRQRAELRKRYPLIGYSLYSNIAFTHLPYHQLLEMEEAVGRAIDGGRQTLANLKTG